VVDKDEVRIRRWNSRHLPIYEPGLGEMVRAARDGLPATASTPAHAPNLFFSADVARCISEADIVIIAVNTPTKSRGAGAGSATDMTAFEAVTAVVVQHARLGAIIVEKSTVPCRTAELVEDMVRWYFLISAFLFRLFSICSPSVLRISWTPSCSAAPSANPSNISDKCLALAARAGGALFQGR
jgi:UDP-glucose 6-dehydrogenase